MPYIGNQHNVGDHVNNFKVLDDISSYTATFDGSATSVVSTSAETIRIPEHRFIQGQRVTYNNGGGSNIGGLTSGTAYYVSFDSANTIKLATSLANANSNTVINLSSVGGGTSHTLNAAFDGINTKFKLTFGSGNSARLNNATQINVAINNVIQRPNLDANNFTDGFALADNHKIVFKTAPTSQDIFWGSIISNTIENFDLRDNEVDNFTGNGSATEFNLSTIPANNESVIVTIDGVLQHPSDKNTSRAYTLLSNIIQFTAAPALNAEIQVRHIGFAGASTNDVSGFYGRTGNVTLTANDHITTGDITSRNINASGIITAASANFGGNVSIGGTLTYEDVANIDSVGIITAKSGIHVTSGQVGIGTDNPQEFLDVVHTKVDQNPGSDDIAVFRKTGSGYLKVLSNNTGRGGIAFGDTNDTFIGALQYDHGDNSMRAYVNNGEKLRITSAGRVGIGTDNPTRNLQIGSLEVDSYNVIRLGRRIASSNTNLPLIGHHSGDGTGSGLALCATSSSGAIHFFTGNGGNGFGANDNEERVVIKHDGKVGIGSQIPSAQLETFKSGTTGYIFRAMAGLSVGNRPYDLKPPSSDSLTEPFSWNTGNAHAFQVDGNEALRITSNGQIGIGTNSPAKALEVTSNTVPQFQVGMSNNSARASLMHNGSHLYFDTTSGDQIFRTGSTSERLRITSAGNVGIGSENPSYKLSIVSGNSDLISLINNQSFGTAGIYFEGARNPGTGIVGDLHFYNRRNTSVVSNLKVNGDGNFTFNQKVGIGTNNPVRPLHILDADCRIRLEDAGFATDVELQNTSGDAVLTTNGASNVRLQTDNTERLRITSTGEVGINVTVPDAKLEVRDSASRGVIVRSTSTQSTDTNKAIRVRNNSDTNTFHVSHKGQGYFATRVGIGSAAPQNPLDIRSSDNTLAVFRSTDSGANIDIIDDDTQSRIRSVDGRLHLFADFDNNVSSSSIKFYIDGSNEKLQINSAGRLLYGNHLNDRGAELQYEGSEHAGIGIHRNSNSHGAPAIQLSASRGTSAGSNTIVQNGDYLGMISFKGTDGSGLANGAFITGIVDGTPGNNDMPARLGFWTSADGSESPTERLRIDKDGNVTKPTNAMFKAGMTDSDVLTSSGWHKISYNTTSGNFFNVGGHFSTSNHRFTAPVNGYYQFGCNQRFDSGNGNYFRLVFRKNGSGDSLYPHGHAIYRDNDGFDYVSLTITSLIYLAANDYVEAWAYSQNDTSWTLHRESQFYGYLVG